MAYSSPVLLKRIPADAAQRKLIRYPDYVATGGYRALVKALAACPEFTGWLAERSTHGRLVDRNGIILMPMGAEG